MLVLSRKKNQTIVIDPRLCEVDELGLIEVTVIEIRGDKVRLGLTAPKEIPVHRQEVYDLVQQDRPAA